MTTTGQTAERAPLRHRVVAEVAPHAVAITVVAALGVAAALWYTGPSWTAPAAATFAVTGAALAVIDLRTHRLPDALVLPSYPLAGVVLAVASIGTEDPAAYGRAVAGCVLLLVAYAGLKLAHPAGLGLGDVKLAGVLGAYLGWAGWDALAVGACAAFVAGGLVSVVLLVTRRATRTTALPFGPFMILGAVLGIAGGERTVAVLLGG
ncbi:prepilin peptidase [Oerskovia flava]|uniref:prepilin peptidase n=1 Tax=Oerskovia flava TaxID=2986422 RepID=UPI0022404273|nr:A24 family peptidase [Oerskovia sp. JB1-3-2]